MNLRTPLPGIARPSIARWPAATAAVAVVLTLTSCGGGEDTTASTGSSSSSAATSSPAASSSSSSAAATGDITALAEAFAATLSEEQRTSLNQEYTFANVTNWSNLPQDLLTGAGFGGGGGGGGALPSGAMPSGGAGRPSGAPSGGGVPGGGQSSTGRVGLATEGFTDEQWTALEDLLRAATGSAENEGFDEILQHLDADDYLADNGGGDTYGRGDFYIAFLGAPGDTGTWELQFGGHHLALANTYTDGALAGATPSFRGIEPFETVTVNGDTVQPEQQEQAAFAAVLGSLSADEQATAKLSTSYNDLLLGPGNDWAFPTTSEGIAGSALTDEQKALVLAAINTYVDDIDDADAATILAKYESELDDTYVSFSGSTSVDQVGDYVRIDGPSVWIEFSMQNGIVLDGAHPHSVWRDKVTDYAGLKS